jgi:hypothetical protein
MTISGTGNSSGTSVLTSTPLNPSCVLLRSFVDTAGLTYTGLIATNSPGSSTATNLANTCVSPAPTSPGVNIVTLNDVTVSCGTGSPTCPAGFSKTGGIVLQTSYEADGLATGPTGSNVDSHLTVVSTTGGLEGVTGYGVSVAHTQATAGVVTTFSTYWLQLTFPNSGE